MIEFFELLVSNDKAANDNIMWGWVFTTSSIFLWVACLFAIIYVGFWLWDFIDDRKVSYRELFLTPIGIFVGIMFSNLILTVVVFSLLNAFAHTFYQIPLIWYAWLSGIIFTVLLARYLRRTHKVVHGHIKDKNAHTDSQDKKVEKLSNSLNKDPFFYNEEE